MIRTQIQLTDEMVAHIKDAAARQHVSMAEMIRRAMAYFLERAANVGAGNRYARASAAAGRFRSGRRNLSVQHNAEFGKGSRR